MSVRNNIGVFVLLVAVATTAVTSQALTEDACNKQLESDTTANPFGPLCDAFTRFYQCIHRVYTENQQWSSRAIQVKATAKAQLSSRGCEYNEAALFGAESTESASDSAESETVFAKCLTKFDFRKQYSSESERCRVGDQFTQCLYDILSEEIKPSEFRADFEKIAKKLLEPYGCELDAAKYFGNSARYSASISILSVLSLLMLNILIAL